MRPAIIMLARFLLLIIIIIIFPNIIIILIIFLILLPLLLTPLIIRLLFLIHLLILIPFIIMSPPLPSSIHPSIQPAYSLSSSLLRSVWMPPSVLPHFIGHLNSLGRRLWMGWRGCAKRHQELFVPDGTTSGHIFKHSSMYFVYDRIRRRACTAVVAR